MPYESSSQNPDRWPTGHQEIPTDPNAPALQILAGAYQASARGDAEIAESMARDQFDIRVNYLMAQQPNLDREWAEATVRNNIVSAWQHMLAASEQRQNQSIASNPAALQRIQEAYARRNAIKAYISNVHDTFGYKSRKNG
jgi:hypothetical protein